MKEETKFLIKKYKHFTGKGELQYSYYYIQELKKFLWWFYWKKDIKHTEFCFGGLIKTRTIFADIKDAQNFVRNVLCPKMPRDGHRETVVDEMTCNNLTFNTKEK